MTAWKSGFQSQTLILTALFTLFGHHQVSAEFLTPVVFASIDDDSPVNGLGDSFSTIPGLLRKLDHVETRAIAEFHLENLRVGDLESARLFLELTVNNAGGLQTRAYDVLLYKGNGQANLYDYFQSAILVDKIAFQVPQAPQTFEPITFELDILQAAQTFLSSQDDFLGIRLRPLGAGHYPTILTNIRLSAVPIPEPAGILLMNLGLGLFWSKRQRLGNRS